MLFSTHISDLNHKAPFRKEAGNEAQQLLLFQSSWTPTS